MTQLEWGKRTYIMGILNVTPDSFSGDGLLTWKDPASTASQQARQFIDDGADILDLGAESSRPGSELVSAASEIERILPILKAIRKEHADSLISIDTYKSETAKACLENGADWINDIWGLKADPELSEIIASLKATVVLMHNRSNWGAVQNHGELGRSYAAAAYDDIVDDIKSELSESIEIAKKGGIAEDKIVLDPGIGFGKSVEHNLEIINRLDEIKSLGFPVLIGPSRKSFIGQVLDLPVEEREEGTAAAVSIGIIRGADIVRVHNVKIMARIAKMSDAIASANTRKR